MAPGGGPLDRTGMAASIAIRPARMAELAPAAELLRQSLDFRPADAVPAWLMDATTRAGGLLLVAVEDHTVVGVSYAFPGHAPSGPPFLFSCGLAVAERCRGRGIGHALKCEQRRRARQGGYDAIRWTADPLNAAALGLYLSRLGARLTGYQASLYDGVRAGHGLPQDDVEIEWPLQATAQGRVAAVAHVTLRADDEEPLAARLRVRARMRALLAEGYTGTAVEPRTAPARVRFEREVP